MIPINRLGHGENMGKSKKKLSEIIRQPHQASTAPTHPGQDLQRLASDACRELIYIWYACI